MFLWEICLPLPFPALSTPQEEVQSVHRYSLSELIAGRDKAGEELESTPDGVIALEKYRDWLAEKEEK